MRRFWRFQSTTWLMLSGFVSLCLISSLLFMISLVVLRSASESREMHKIDTNMKVAWELLHQLGQNLHLEGGKLFAGSVPLVGNSALVDRVQSLVGGTATLFQGDTRIATNVLDEEGQRGVGTRLSVAEVRDTVLQQGKLFRGAVDVLGIKYYAAYDPIFDQAGSVIGILYVGDEVSGVLDALSRRTEWLLGVPAGAIVLIGVLFLLLVAKLTAQIEARQVSLQTMHGQLDTALANMANGLALWSGDKHLLLFNSRLSEVLGVPEERIWSGMSFDEFLQARYDVGSVADTSFETYHRDTMAMVERRQACGLVYTGRDGRTLSLLHRPTVLDGWVTTYEDVTERHTANAKISFMAHFDPLTGLSNRTLYDQRLEEALANARLSGGQIAVFGLDLDQFKPVNDTLGHAAGDKLLKAVGKRLSGLLRDTDLVARLGGDEFAILMPLPAEGSRGHLSLAGRVVTSLSEPFNIDDQQIVIGVSVGIALFPRDGSTGSELLRCADIAMYRAKEAGRNTFLLFEAVMDEELQDRRALERDLRVAIETESLKLHYQPIVCCSTSAVEGYEALLRWDHPERGSIPPSVFVPLAEETNQMLRLGKWVMDTACLTAAGWEGQTRVAVNLSPVQFRQHDLVEMIFNALEQAGLDPTRLEIEITEGLLIDDPDRTVDILTRFRAAGIRISLDDFGTGYSSLSYLRHFPLDKIKIDKSFVDNMASDSQSASIVKSLVSLAHTLNLAVTAEGVETREQLDALQQHCCDQVQGYLLGRPKPSKVGRPRAEPEKAHLGNTQQIPDCQALTDGPPQAVL